MKIVNLKIIALFTFLLLLPTQLGGHFFLPFSYLSGVRIDYLAPTLYVTDILAILLIALNIKFVVRFFNRKEFFILFILAAINIAFSLNQPIAIYKWIKILELLGIFAVVKNVPRISPLLPFAIGAFVESGLAIWQFVTKHSLQGPAYWLGERYLSLSLPDVGKASLFGTEILRPYATFSHPNSLAGFYLLIYFFVLTKKPSSRSSTSMLSTKYLLLFLSSLLIFLSFSKIAILIFLILNILYLIRSQFYRHCILCFVGRVSGLLAIAGIVLFAHGDVLSVAKRITLIQNALDIFKNHPLFGVGLGNYLFAQYQYTMKYPYFFLQPVHNIFLLLLSETGLVLGGFILYQMCLSLKLSHDSRLTTRDSLLYCLAVILLTGLFDHYWLTLQQNLLLLPVIFGLLYQSKK